MNMSSDFLLLLLLHCKLTDHSHFLRLYILSHLSTVRDYSKIPSAENRIQGVLMLMCPLIKGRIIHAKF